MASAKSTQERRKNKLDKQNADDLVLEPADLSDVVLVVEGRKFKCHRLILSMWSPVFKTMFTADFKEKHSLEIPLKGKKADEIKEMLLVIYPRTRKPITEENCYFLLQLADEYQMDQVKEMCEDYLLATMKGFTPPYSWSDSNVDEDIRCIDLLILSQDYNLEKLLKDCLPLTAELELKRIMAYHRYKQLSKTNEREIYFLRLQDLEEKQKEMENERDIFIIRIHELEERKNKVYKAKRRLTSHLVSIRQQLKSKELSDRVVVSAEEELSAI